MITKEKFIKIVNDYFTYSKNIDDIINYINFDNYIYEYPNLIFEQLMQAYFNNEGCDWISYFIWEKPENSDCIWDEDNNEIPLKNLNDLWELVKEYRI